MRKGSNPSFFRRLDRLEMKMFEATMPKAFATLKALEAQPKPERRPATLTATIAERAAITR